MATEGNTALKTTTDFLTWIELNSPKDVVQLGKHMIYGRETKYVTAHFDPKKHKQLEIIHLTDVQFGHVCCREDRLREWCDWILASPDRFVLLGGDLVDAATQFSIANPYENKWRPSEQCMRFVEIVLPIRHRILAYVGGNHERRTDRTFGSLGLFIASLLRVPYSEGQQFIDIYFGEHGPFRIDLWHGAGSAKTKGAKAQMLERYAINSDAQLCLVGHLHDALLLWMWKRYRKGNRVRLQKRAVGMSSSFLEFWGTYAEVAGLPASDTMMVRCVLEPSGHWEVTMR